MTNKEKIAEELLKEIQFFEEISLMIEARMLRDAESEKGGAHNE